MKRIDSYRLEDFVQDPDFQNWVLDESDVNASFWKEWSLQHPEKYDLIEQAKSLVVALQFNAIELEQDAMRKSVDRILKETEEKGWRPAWRIAGAAAAVLVLAMLAGQWLRTNEGKETLLSAYTPGVKAYIHTNNGSEVNTFLLKDGSSVHLFPSSSLEISPDFDKADRKVWLKGEAIFEVTKDANRPFLVHADEVVTRVLGTEFRVRALENDERVMVSVSAGKVSVFKHKENNSRSLQEIVLSPNQQAIFLKKEDRLIKTLVTKPEVIASDEMYKDFQFSETPIPDVLNVISKSYGIQIMYDTLMLKNCNLTAILTSEPLFEKLDLICETIHAKYEIIDGQIIVYGSGCEH